MEGVGEGGVEGAAGGGVEEVAGGVGLEEEGMEE